MEFKNVTEGYDNLGRLSWQEILEPYSKEVRIYNEDGSYYALLENETHSKVMLFNKNDEFIRCVS